MEFLSSIILLWQFLLFSTNNIWWTNTTKTIFFLIFTIITTIADFLLNFFQASKLASSSTLWATLTCTPTTSIPSKFSVIIIKFEWKLDNIEDLTMDDFDIKDFGNLHGHGLLKIRNINWRSLTSMGPFFFKLSLFATFIKQIIH